VPECIDPVFARTSLKRSFSLIENEIYDLCIVLRKSAKNPMVGSDKITVFFLIIALYGSRNYV
jgi:hypothetical protein